MRNTCVVASRVCLGWAYGVWDLLLFHDDDDDNVDVDVHAADKEEAERRRLYMLTGRNM